MQYVALVECLQLVRDLAAKAASVAAAAAAAGAGAATGKGGSTGGASAAGPAAVRGMEELAHALGALEALLSDGAGDTSASGERKGVVFVRWCRTKMCPLKSWFSGFGFVLSARGGYTRVSIQRKCFLD